MKRILAILLVAIGAWFYFTPHIAVHGLQAAAQARDASRLASYVDFPALREDLKGTLSARLQEEFKAKRSAGGNELLAAFGAAMLTSVMNPLIDAMVTPDGLARVIAGEKLLAPGDATAPQSSASPSPPAPATPPQRGETSKLSMSYESFDTFVARAQKKADQREPAALVFTRDGWFSWKLTGIRLPK